MSAKYNGPDYKGRIGLLGGSFNPVHIGHLSVAQQVRDLIGLQKVVLLPNHRSPFKQEDASVAAPEHRLAMCRLATQGLRGLDLSDLEVQAPPPSYTVDTFKKLNAQGWRPVMILGLDALLSLPDWHNAAQLPEQGDFVYVNRPGFDITPEVRQRFEVVFGAAVAERILSACVPIETSGISSSEIRARLREGKAVQRFLRADVHAYIQKHKLYAS